jgi:hypothetical protein
MAQGGLTQGITLEDEVVVLAGTPLEAEAALDQCGMEATGWDAKAMGKVRGQSPKEKEGGGKEGERRRRRGERGRMKRKEKKGERGKTKEGR